MIHIDIYVPALNETFEFKCDEEAFVADVSRDIADFVMYRSGIRSPAQDISGFWLCHIRGRQILSGTQSLKDQGVEQGSKMIFL